MGLLLSVRARELCIRAGLLALSLPAFAASSLAQPRSVDVPLVVPHEFLQRLLVQQVFTEPQATARITAEAACNEVVLSKPRVGHSGGHLVVTAHAVANAGFSVMGGCVQPFRWEGEVEAEEDARLAPDAPVVLFPVVDSSLRSDEESWLAVPALWNWVKPVVHPRLEVLRVDLGPLVSGLRSALPLFAVNREEAAVRRLADSIALVGASVEARGLVLRLSFEVEPAPPSAPERAAAPEPPLSPVEALALEEALREWDAFVTFVVKTAGHDALRPELRLDLLAALLDARHELVDALAEPARRDDDRVRALFSSAWKRLAPALIDLAGRDDGYRYLAFVASGDALAALDAAGPGFGVEISTDGLRRLARTLAPAATVDPLRWSDEVDPELRETFGFDAPLPALPPLETREPPIETREPPIEEDLPGDDPTGQPPGEEPPGGDPPGEGRPGEPLDDAPGARPDPSSEAPPPLHGALSRLRSLAGRLADALVGPASAAPAALPPPGPYTSALDGLAPRIADLDSYLPQVAALLHDSASQVFVHGRLGPEHRELFRHLVLAAAWQESCWRQYVDQRGRIEPLRSSIGALGLMQVSPRVWRGFYAVDGLSWSIGYNARAGSEILLHYLSDYAIARGEAVLGGPDALARASYAAYHGGPVHLRRYREPARWRGALVAVDRAFHEKYRAVAAGGELRVRECFPG